MCHVSAVKYIYCAKEIDSIPYLCCMNNILMTWICSLKKFSLTHTPHTNKVSEILLLLHGGKKVYLSADLWFFVVYVFCRAHIRLYLLIFPKCCVLFQQAKLSFSLADPPPPQEKTVQLIRCFKSMSVLMLFIHPPQI